MREELLRSKKIRISENGDTLFVALLSQYPRVKNSDYGRDGKYGEISLSIVSKNGKAASTSNGKIGINDGALYYTALQLISKLAVQRFEFEK
ncbi:MAG: hypothetical protein WCI91_03085 [Candidatus Nomurabacteria bacterium]